MKKRYGSERWRTAVGGAMGALLAFTLVGTVPMAFAEGKEDAPEVTDETTEEGVGSLDESAFRLGDVKLNVIAQGGEGAVETLALGIPVERTYIVTNEGERAHVRLESALICGDLVQVNRLGVRDTPKDGAGGAPEGDAVPAEGDDDESTSPAAGAPVWHLADDGWWYRSEPLEPGESIAVHVKVEMPLIESWEEAFRSGAPGSVEETLRVEGVQARNMSVDLGQVQPWGDLQVETRDVKAKHEEVTA